MNKPTYYEFFNLPNFEADQDKIKRAYRSMALKHHPDRGGSLESMKNVNEVFRVLSTKKDEYDKHLRNKLSPKMRVRVMTNYGIFIDDDILNEMERKRQIFRSMLDPY